MKFLNRREPETAEDLAFAERLSAIANRSKAAFESNSMPESLPNLATVERRFWDSSEISDSDTDAAAA